jgi:uncharacterized membrane protein required for colicin V production
MNGVDLLFVALLIGGLALGFAQGTVRLMIAIIALYIGIILASLYFQIVGEWLRTRLGSTVQVGQIVAFALIMISGLLLLSAAGFYTFRYVQVPASLEFIDRVLGLMLGLVLSALILGMFALFLSSLFINQNAAGTFTFPVTRWFQSSARTSILLPFFGSNVLPFIYATLRPVLPPESGIIFQGL